MLAIDRDATQREVHRTAEEIISAKHPFCVEALLDRPFNKAAIAGLQRLEARR